MKYRIERRRGVAAYQQIVEQTKRALRTGTLRVGDRLPTAREVAETCAVNPNTTLKAYRELEREGVVELRQGIGTFVARAPEPFVPDAGSTLHAELYEWTERALRSGMAEDDVRELLETALARYGDTAGDVLVTEERKGGPA
ncbi:GntR family transcriptional regulator [Streptomyces sp. NPDC054784]